MTAASNTQAGLDAVDILTADHREMVELFREIKQSSDPNRKKELSDTVIAEVMRHAVAEKMYVYPAIEEHVPNGAKMVEHDKEEHQEVVEVMKALEGIDAFHSSFLEHIVRLEGLLRHHAHDEESNQFPQLRQHIPPERLLELGKQVLTAKELAPTRPHPSAPHSALFHKMVGLGVGLIDRLRDKLSGRHMAGR